MLEVDLSNYDYVIATPPCNYWSYARGNRCSQYAKDTMHLLPSILDKLIKLNKPFIVENVRNAPRFKEHGLLPREDCYTYIIGRHTYWSNVLFDADKIDQRQDFVFHGYTIQYDDMENKSHQGGYNVFNVIERFLYTIHENEKMKEGMIY